MQSPPRRTASQRCYFLIGICTEAHTFGIVWWIWSHPFENKGRLSSFHLADQCSSPSLRASMLQLQHTQTRPHFKSKRWNQRLPLSDTKSKQSTCQEHMRCQFIHKHTSSQVACALSSADMATPGFQSVLSYVSWCARQQLFPRACSAARVQIQGTKTPFRFSGGNLKQ